jgi:hypothetical protein
VSVCEMTFSPRIATDEIHAIAINVRSGFRHAPDLAEVWPYFACWMPTKWRKQPEASHGPAIHAAFSIKEGHLVSSQFRVYPLDSRPTPWDGCQTGGRYSKWWLWTMTMLYS